jgi:AcrR family transcriptional regulator
MSKAAATRMMILGKAFELIYRQGYQATSVDDIIATTKVTKGAFFYHFKTKDEMGLAMINELMYPGMYDMMVKPLLATSDPLREIYKMMRHILLKDPFFHVQYGCPAVNLVDEMAPLSETFNHALSRLMIQWRDVIEAGLNHGKLHGTVRKDVHARDAACFITAGYGGIRNMGKLFGTPVYNTYLKELKNYLGSLS